MNNKQSYTELVILLVLTVLFTSLMIYLDVFDLFYQFSRSNESWELDEIIISIPFLTIGLLVFGIRRMRDIHKEEKRLEDAEKRALLAASIRENEERFRSLFENVSMVAVQGYDADLRVIYWNTASEHLYGYTQQEVLGKHIGELLFPQSILNMELERLSSALRDSITPMEHELELRHRSGVPVPVRTSYVIRQSVAGNKELYRVDISLAESKKNLLQLAMAKESAEKANKAKSEFLANMSHEIRTPLNGLLGMLQLLETTVTQKESREYVHLAIDASRRLTRLLSDILDLSKVEAGKMTIQSFPFDLLETMNQIYELFHPMSDQTGIALNFYLHPMLPRFVVGDANRLQQICNNLLGNAFKFTSTGSISLEAYPLPQDADGQQKILFAVSDTGIGISSEEFNRLFQAFSQVDSGFTKKDRGVGLGLHISQRLVELMGGSIDVSSEPGTGTTFYFCISVGQTTALSSGSAADSSALQNPLHSASVLLAEDDEISALVVMKQLEILGCSVRHAQNGREVLDLLRDHSFDAVLMDVQMPVMDGVAATIAIRNGEAGENNTEIPIIALTAYAMLGDRQKMIDAGMDSYVAKPIELKQLEKTLIQMLDPD